MPHTYSNASKYKAHKTIYNGQVYDSRKEAGRALELEAMQERGEIRDLRRQVRYEIIPAYRDPETGKVIERASYYIADFVYKDKNGLEIVEDVKGVRTDLYRLKKKLMLSKYGITIKET